MGEVYLEEWRISGFGDEAGLHVDSADIDLSLRGLGTNRSDLVRAAPAMVRMLLRYELVSVQDKNGYLPDVCPECDIGSGKAATAVHCKRCPLDALLTLLGFPDQDSRDEARRKIREGGK